MKTRIKLNQGEELKHDNHRSKGTMAETDIDTYSVVSQDGNIVGKVIYTDHTAIRGFRRTQTVVQTDSSGKVIVDESW
ncbi:hypothetical protein [Vibrio atlanticus]|uniref:hypothetical protein n=1 Tax=Vibrio atlanticus TaxID=693153 RepID=UPI003D1035B0